VHRSSGMRGSGPYTHFYMTQTLPSSHADTVRRIATDLKGRPGPLLEVLHAIQAALGYVPEGAVPLVAEELNITRAEVHGVVTFYHYFRRTPPGKHVVSLCRAEACQSMGADALAEHVKQRLGVDFHETTDDGQFSLEPVFCLGNCACSPAAMVDGELHGRLTPERIDAVIAARSGKKQ
jgi:formate dehydrogenase subunit gamma